MQELSLESHDLHADPRKGPEVIRQPPHKTSGDSIVISFRSWREIGEGTGSGLVSEEEVFLRTGNWRPRSGGLSLSDSSPGDL